MDPEFGDIRKYAPGRHPGIILFRPRSFGSLAVNRFVEEFVRDTDLELLIEQNKERYYETLEQSSRGWHEGKHDPWPYINYLLSILKYAYREFEDRVAQLKSRRGAKTEQVGAAVKAFVGTFTLHELERACLGVTGYGTKSVKAGGQVCS